MFSPLKPHEGPRPTPTVLVVDDLEDARRVMARLVRMAGYRPVLADGGRAALSALDSEEPDLMILDLTMPDMDGLAVLRQLRADPRWQRLPVVLFTGISSGPEIEEAKALGIREHVVKGAPASLGFLDRLATHLPHN